jgi:hypothetical protein
MLDYEDDYFLEEDKMWVEKGLRAPSSSIEYYARSCYLSLKTLAYPKRPLNFVKWFIFPSHCRQIVLKHLVTLCIRALNSTKVPIVEYVHCSSVLRDVGLYACAVNRFLLFASAVVKEGCCNVMSLFIKKCNVAVDNTRVCRWLKCWGRKGSGCGCWKYAGGNVLKLHVCQFYSYLHLISSEMLYKCFVAPKNILCNW